MNFTKEIKDKRRHAYTLSFGQAHAGQQVSIDLKQHSFKFGCNGFGILNGDQTYAQLFENLFNAATLPFYWGRYEPVEGQTNEEKIREASQWFRSRGISLKGHPLAWHTVCADWLLAYDTPTIYRKQMDRIARDVSAFAGLIDTWDVINEVVILPRFDRYDNAISRLAREYGAEELTLDCFKKARETNPEAVLLLNDFNHSAKYEQLIERLLDKGCPIDAIGIQTHQHQGYHGVEYIQDVLERFSRFGLPLHFTEVTILSGDLAPAHYDDLNDAEREDWPSTEEGEEIQLQQVTEFYSHLYAHPQVESIVWWDMLDGNWLNAPAGLVRRDMSPKPAYLKLQDLIRNDWGFPEKTVTLDEKGSVDIDGPEGLYTCSINGRTIEIELNKQSRNTEVTIA
ncbi:endo-1,4-beta-xylanase [Spirochaeta dissipatitropha]